MQDILIRQFKPEDKNSVRNIAVSTAFMGEPGSIFFEDDEILADFLTLYYTDYEPESSFVAEAGGGKVVGYILGAKSISNLDRIFKKKILPGLLWKALLRGSIFKKKNLKFIFNCVKSFIKNEFRAPDFSETYPASLHINIRENFRNLEIGSKLISAYVNYLRNCEIRGVLLNAISEKAGFFFLKEGFELLYQAKRSYFKYILKKDMPVYVYGKKL